MLAVEDAYRLSMVCKTVRVDFKVFVAHRGCKMPRELAAARLFGGRWTAERAAALLENADATPYKTANNMIKQLFRYILPKEVLYSIGYDRHNVCAMRLALAMKASAQQKESDFL